MLGSPGRLPPPDKRARPTVTHPVNAIQNWSGISRNQVPIVLKVTERANVRQLLCFANGPNGGKLMSELKGLGHADADDDEGTSEFSNQREMQLNDTPETSNHKAKL